MSRPTVVRLAIFLATVVATWGVLSLGSTEADPELKVGGPAPQDYEAETTADVTDTEATEVAKQAARDAVNSDLAREPQLEVESSVRSQVSGVFDDVEMAAVAENPDAAAETPPELPTTTTTTADPEETTGATEPEEPAMLTGRVFIDVDGDGLYVPEGENPRVDKGIQGVTIAIETYDETVTTVTLEDGSWNAEIAGGAGVVSVQADDTAIPENFIPSSQVLSVLVECDSGQSCNTEDVAFIANTRAVDELAMGIKATYDLLDETIDYLSLTAVDDVWRGGLGEVLHMPRIRSAADSRLTLEFGRRITEDTLQAAKTGLRNDPPLVLHTDTGQDVAGGQAAGDVAANDLG